MVVVNSTMAGAFEFIKEIKGTADTMNGNEHTTLTSPKRMPSRPTSEE